MKKKLLLLLSIFIIIGIIIYIIGSHLYFHTRVEFTYDAEKAVAYSYQYVHERNKAEFAVFQYNCTNYILQCLLAGNIEMDGTAPTSISRTNFVK